MDQNYRQPGQVPVYGTTEPDIALKKQNRLLCVIAAICAVLLLINIVCMAIIIPPVTSFLGGFSGLGESISLSDALDTLEELQLLISESRDGVEQAAEKIEEFDVETLNETIQSLNTIIEPLANLFGQG